MYKSFLKLLAHFRYSSVSLFKLLSKPEFYCRKFLFTLKKISRVSFVSRCLIFKVRCALELQEFVLNSRVPEHNNMFIFICQQLFPRFLANSQPSRAFRSLLFYRAINLFPCPVLILSEKLFSFPSGSLVANENELYHYIIKMSIPNFNFFQLFLQLFFQL